MSWRNSIVVAALIGAGGAILAASTGPLTQYLLAPRGGDEQSTKLSPEVYETQQQEATTPDESRPFGHLAETPEDSEPPTSRVSTNERASPEGSQGAGSSGPKEVILGGGETVSITPKGVLLSMIGTPYTERSDLVGVKINGQTESLRVGERYPVQGIDDDCEISLLKIDQSAGKATFQFHCNS